MRETNLVHEAFVAGRIRQHYDEEPVPGASIERDLDQGRLLSYLATRRESAVLNQLSDKDILIRTGVLTVDGQVSVAGLLMLGVYPQQFFPTFTVQAAVTPSSNDPAGLRARDLQVFDGPIPAIVEQARSWVARNTATDIWVDDNGDSRDIPTYPAIAVRELIVNSLVHRDLGPHARSSVVDMRLSSGQLIITNPGGLFGLSVENLGKTPSNTRNQRLAEIAMYVSTRDGQRLIERLGSGIPAVQAALADAGMSPPVFRDTGLRFTARLLAERPSPAAAPSGMHSGTGSTATDEAAGEYGAMANRLLETLGRQSLTRRQLAEATGMSVRAVGHHITKLRDAGLIVMDGAQGSRDTRYRKA